MESRFLLANAKWLDVALTFKAEIAEANKTNLPGTSSGSRGRPKKLFPESSSKTKKRKVELLLNITPERLNFATEMTLRKGGRRDAARIVKEITESSPQRATKLKKAFHRPAKDLPKKLSSEEALALFVDTKLTKHQYTVIRKVSIKQNANIYPGYDQLLDAKKACYPKSIKISEISAEVNLQALLNHTVQRLIMSIEERLLNELTTDEKKNIKMIYKWGCDGASGQGHYKQKFTNQPQADDSFLFVISMVPLQMTCNGKVLWQNPKPSSTSYCRPIKLIFKKETAEMTKKEVAEIEQQISGLSCTELLHQNHRVMVSHQLVMTMVNGKVCNAVMGQSSQKCYICGATPTQMNNLKSHQTRTVNPLALTFGISNLHAWIRCFECLLHIAYRVNTKTWQIKKHDKEAVELRKKLIQDKFKEETGLLVDVPKPGSGTTNDGNTARRFFKNPEISSRITGINQELIKRFGVILEAISTGHKVNLDAFNKYTFATAEMYVKEYGWYYMPASVHKLLIHGGDIISSAILPIGQLSEEAQEARNKNCKGFRERHSRKFSRQETMEDLMHMLLITSDPLITSLRTHQQKKSSTLSPDVLSLLQTIPEASTEIELDTMDTDTEEDSPYELSTSGGS
ncbi:uncharacterized protein LOC135126834 [Zophobas morio]|uniref:uncharacterized protein LOC135126834 n=1 Tax=Zophobas morio TaxID=2755281 RepID=UPI003083A15F